MTELETKPGKIGKAYPVNHSRENSAPTAQASIVGDRFGVVAMIIALLALVLAIVLIVSLWRLSSDLQTARSLIEKASEDASRSAVSAAVANERADKAERSAALSREYAVQVYPQLNRLGYPIMSPGEENHPVALPEDYARLDNFSKGHK